MQHIAPTAFLATCLTSAVASQTPVLLKDINTTKPANESAYPSVMTPVGNDLLFSAFSLDPTRVTRGSELFGTRGVPGTTALVRDINPGTFSSFPRSMISLGNIAIFGASDAGGRGLFRTDGTPAGTTLLRQTTALPGAGTAFNGRAYFFLGPDLWTSDGTTAGTRLVRTLNFGFSGAQPTIAVLNNQLLLTGGDLATGAELWRSDGTTAGTGLVRDINPGALHANPQNFHVHMGALYFVATQSATGQELWRSDGTTVGTRIVRDVNPGPAHGIVTTRPHEFVPILIASAGNRVIFKAYTVAAGMEMWTTDGTAAGTALLRDIIPGQGEGAPNKVVSLGRFALFSSRSSLSTYGLWRTDGTPAGTTLIGPIFGEPRQFYRDGNRAFLTLFDTTVGRELFVTDGTAAGTRLVKDIRPGSPGSDPSFLGTAPNGDVLLSADDGIHGREIWSTDGTPAGTRLVDDIVSPPANSTVGSSPRPLIRADGATYFSAYDGSSSGLWKTDGTTAGTTHLTSVQVGGGDYPQLMPAGAALYFNAGDAAGTELWFSDGTRAGTRRVADILPGPGSSYPRDGVALRNGTLLFSADTGQNRELWASDGTAAGTRQVRDIRPGGSSSPSLLTRFRNEAAFVAYDGSSTGLWLSDTTSAGTRRVAQFTRTPTETIVVGHTLYVYEPTNPGQLWASDGTAAGTRVVYRIFPPANSVAMAAVGRVLYILSDRELTRYDGTTGSVVADLQTGITQQQFARHLVAAGDRLYFSGRANGASWPVLWTSDGTAAGTAVVRPASGGFAFVGGSSLRGNQILNPAGTRKIYFAGTTGPNGPLEPWTSDGTTAGTRPIADLWPGAPASNPMFMTHGHNQLIFTADDGIFGPELYTLAIGGNAERHNPGCARSGRPLELSANDPVLGQTLTIAVDQAPPRGFGVVGIGLPAPGGGLQFANGCMIPVDYGLPHFLLFFTATPAGQWSTNIPIPNDPTLRGVYVASQAGVGPTATGPLGIDLSNALFLGVGR